MSLRRPASLALALVAAAMMLVVAAVPVWGQGEPPEMCTTPGGATPTQFGGPGITSPTDGADLVLASVKVTAEFSTTPPAQMTCLSAVVIPDEGQPLPQVGERVTGTEQSLKLDWTAPERTYNGRYRVQFVVTARRGSVLPEDYRQTPSRTVWVLAPSAAPANVAVEPKGVNTAVVSWDRNTEPDVFAYVLQRTDPQGEVTIIEGPTQPSTAERVTFTDKTPAGGKYSYAVVAVRPGKPNEPVLSPASTPKEATVAGASTGTGSGTGSTGGTGTGSTGTSGSGSTGDSSGGSTATTSPTASTGKVDLSSFGALLDARRRATTTVTAPAPDPGFGETLPFQAADEPALGDDSGQELGAEDAQGTSQETITDDSDRQRALASIAGALLLFVLFLHVRLLKSEVDREDELATEEPAAYDDDVVGDDDGPAMAAAPLARVAGDAVDAAALDVLDVPLDAPPPAEARPRRPRRSAAAPPVAAVVEEPPTPEPAVAAAVVLGGLRRRFGRAVATAPPVERFVDEPPVAEVVEVVSETETPAPPRAAAPRRRYGSAAERRLDVGEPVGVPATPAPAPAPAPADRAPSTRRRRRTSSVEVSPLDVGEVQPQPRPRAARRPLPKREPDQQPRRRRNAA